MAHLVGEGVGVAHPGNLGEGVLVENPLARPENVGKGHGVADPVDVSEKLTGEIAVLVVEGLVEVFDHMIGKTAAYQVQVVAGCQVADACVQLGAVAPAFRIRAFGPLQGRGERWCDVQAQRRLGAIKFVGVEQPVIASRIGGGAIVHPILDDAGGLDRLVAVGEQHHLRVAMALAVLVAVVAHRAIPPEVPGKLSIQVNVLLVLPKIGGQPVVCDGVGQVVVLGDVVFDKVGIHRTPASRQGGENLKAEAVRIAVPTRIQQGLAVDGHGDGIEATGPADPGHSVGGDPPGFNGGGQGIRAVPCVVPQIRIDKYPGGRIGFGPVGTHHGFPAHVGSETDALGEGALADSRVTGVHHDVSVDVR